MNELKLRLELDDLAPDMRQKVEEFWAKDAYNMSHTVREVVGVIKREQELDEAMKVWSDFLESPLSFGARQWSWESSIFIENFYCDSPIQQVPDCCYAIIWFECRTLQVESFSKEVLASILASEDYLRCNCVGEYASYGAKTVSNDRDCIKIYSSASVGLGPLKVVESIIDRLKDFEAPLYGAF